MGEAPPGGRPMARSGAGGGRDPLPPSGRPFRRGPAGFSLLGLILGGCQAIAGTGLPGLYGAALDLADLATIGGIYTALGAMAGAGLWLLLAAHLARMRTGTARGTLEPSALQQLGTLGYVK